MVPISYYIALSAVLFTLGSLGVLIRRNIIVIFMSVELMLNSANLAFVAFARYHQEMTGQVFVFFVITVAAAEVAVGRGEPVDGPAQAQVLDEPRRRQVEVLAQGEDRAAVAGHDRAGRLRGAEERAVRCRYRRDRLRGKFLRSPGGKD